MRTAMASLPNAGTMMTLSRVENLYPDGTVYEISEGLLFVLGQNGNILNVWKFRGTEWIVTWGASPNA
jgi:hypothetical protein